ncbi:hypothetical protein D8S78_09640 [Natrialba swarupiae]|nr:hypothetical protein [Natrialba swarupiae]
MRPINTGRSFDETPIRTNRKPVRDARDDPGCVTSGPARARDGRARDPSVEPVETGRLQSGRGAINRV